jgi:hypothetical protein
MLELSEFHRNSAAKDGVQSKCKVCHITAVCAAQKVNPERRRETSRRYRERHPEVHKASDLRWKAKDPKRARALAADKSRRWRAANKAAVRELTRASYARKRKAEPNWADKSAIRFVYEKAREWGMEVDHVVPLSSPIVCGLHCHANLQLLHRSVNVRKSNKEWPDMPTGCAD